MLKIGVSACFMYPDPSRLVFGPKTLSYIENDMAKYVTKAGVLPVLIPEVEEELIDGIVAELDGFVFQGGTDLAPEAYGEKPIGRWKGDPFRDAYELKLFDKAMKSKKPILAICRGMQLMNVYFGGSLYQDTETQVPDVLIHRDAEAYDFLSHKIVFSKGKILEKIYKNETSDHINSVHHQSVKLLGKNLEILAESPEDGIIEAIGYTKAPDGWVMGVQWHPEFSETLKDSVVNADRLYDFFLTQVKSISDKD
ncbi:MAG: gamma-glutamyl-gamma-aminobutyrate hydrolase family protein [Marinoscillum sp.]